MYTYTHNFTLEIIKENKRVLEEKITEGTYKFKLEHLNQFWPNHMAGTIMPLNCRIKYFFQLVLCDTAYFRRPWLPEYVQRCHIPTQKDKIQHFITNKCLGYTGIIDFWSTMYIIYEISINDMCCHFIMIRRSSEYCPQFYLLNFKRAR